MFRGREITHPELGRAVLQRMSEALSDVATQERQPLMEGRRMDIIMTPNPIKPKTKTEVKTEAKTAVKTEAKTETKTEAKTEVKAVTKEKEPQNAKA